MRAKVFLVAVGALMGNVSGGVGAQAGAAAVEAVIATNGGVSLRAEGRQLAAVLAAVGLDGGQELLQSGAEPKPDDPANVAPVRRASLRAAGKVRIDLETRAVSVPGGLKLTYRATPTSDVTSTGIHLVIELPEDLWQGGRWWGACAGATPAHRAAADERQGQIPEDYSGQSVVFTFQASTLRLTGRNRHRLSLIPAESMPVVFIDDRKWQPHFTVRVGPLHDSSERWGAGQTRTFGVTLAAEVPLKPVFDEPVTIRAGDQWAPIEAGFEIAPGSALDFSHLGLADGPAGKHGWLRSVGGHFEFAEAPGKPVRFYGVNFCYDALYLEHAQCDRLADRLARTGYNSVRIHHYERGLVDPAAADSLTFHGDALDKLDYFVAAMKKRGLYVTTDLFVSRPVRAAEVVPGGKGLLGSYQYKMLVPLSDRALENFQEFARRLLTHVNPYTGLAWKDDPAIAMLSLVNEGMLLNTLGRMDDHTRSVWRVAFNRWLLGTYDDRGRLAEAWGKALGPDQDPAQGTVPLPPTFGDDAPGRDLARFAAETQLEFFRRMKRFLREEVGYPALLTDMNGWTEIPQNQYPRSFFDYIDAHFYWDHPIFLRNGWQLPSRGWSGGGSAVAARGSGPRERALNRLFELPFTITEYNYVGPNKCRAESGLLTGAFAALQDWSGVWRYAYASHRRDAAILFEPLPLTYFDLMCDPLNQATERAVICLYLRGDAAPAQTRVAIRASRKELLQSPRTNRLNVRLSELGWVTQIGMSVSDLAGIGEPPQLQLPLAKGASPQPAAAALLAADPLSTRAPKLALQALRDRKLLCADNATDMDRGLFVSQTGQVRLDSRAALLTVNTPGTAGLFSQKPREAQAGPLRVELKDCGGAVWVSSLDHKRIERSRRLLLVHLTDLQNSGARFADRQRLVLEDWGHVPYLVRAGRAEISLATAESRSLRVWALDTTGRRVGEIDSEAVANPAQGDQENPLPDGQLTFTAATRGPRDGCLYYEIAAD